jgi:hypothetical protein
VARNSHQQIGGSTGSAARHDITRRTSMEETITGIPLWLLRAYLEELGGHAEVDGRVTGAGWAAYLAPAPPCAVGSLRVGRVRLALRGNPETLRALRVALDKKLLRGGG